jgi:CRISPR-associated endonuclease Cas1
VSLQAKFTSQGTLLIRNGLTHYPQQREEFCFFKGEPAIPPRIITLDGSGWLSFEVIDWLAEQQVPIVRINWKGEVVSVLGGSGFSADRAKVCWQIETRYDPARRIEFATKLIAHKIANSIETLETVLPASTSRETAVSRLRREHERLQLEPPSTVPQLLGNEGRAGAAYFKAWEGVPLRWKATARRPIPDSWRSIGPRASAHGGKAKNVRASHPLNAALNLAYAVLQSQVQIEAVAAGYDPTLGIMHHGYQGFSGFGFRPDGAAPAEGGRGCSWDCSLGDVQRGGFRDQDGWRGEAGAAIGETGLPTWVWTAERASQDWASHCKV